MTFKDFIGRLFRGKSASGEEMTLRQLIDFLNLGDVSKDKLSEATYFACLKVLGESVGKLPLKLLQQTPEGGVEKAYRHPLYRVAGMQPNPYMTSTHFWSTVEYSRNHYGNAYVWVQGAGRQTALWPLPFPCVQVWIDNQGLWGRENALWYVYTHPGSGRQYKIPHDSMLHFKTSTSFDGIRGLSVRDTLADTLNGNLTAQAMLNRAYENGFTGKAVLQYTGTASSENEKIYGQRIQDFIDSKTGLKNVIPMAYGTTLTPFAVKLAENEFLGLKKYSALQIAAAFGIKPNQINDYEKSSYASAEAQQLAFYVDTLLYILKHYEEELTCKLLTDQEIEDGYYFKFNVSVILRADQKTQIDSLRMATQAGIYTLNEARAFLDKESKPGGDILMVNGTMVPATEVGAAYKKRGEGYAEPNQ